MGFVNKVMLLGNTTRTPELRELPSGTKLCDFGLAINRTYKTAAGEEKQETVFVDCTAFGRTAEVIAEYCPTGRALFIEGRLHYETWDDKNGNKRNKLSVIVESFQFIGSRDAATGKPRDAAPSSAPASDGAFARNPAQRPARHRTTGRSAPRSCSAERRERQPQPVAAAVDQTAEVAATFDDADLPF